MAIWGGLATPRGGQTTPCDPKGDTTPNLPLGLGHPHGSNEVTGHLYYFIKVLNFLLFLFLFSFLKLNNI
jgi:hypothetical protein